MILFKNISFNVTNDELIHALNGMNNKTDNFTFEDKTKIVDIFKGLLEEQYYDKLRLAITLFREEKENESN